MGLDPAILNQEHIRRMLSHSERKARDLPTNAESSAKAEAKSEKALQEQLVAYLHLRGVKRVVRSAMHRKTTTALGTPDLIFCFVGRDLRPDPICWEIKLPGGNLTVEQELAASDFLCDGWHYSIVRSVEQAKQILDSL